MPTATMTSKGQITIPAKVRKALGLMPGIRVDFYEVADGEYALRPKIGSIMELKGCLAGDGPPATIEEMNQAILDHAATQDRAAMSDSIGNQRGGELLDRPRYEHLRAILLAGRPSPKPQSRSNHGFSVSGPSGVGWVGHCS